MTKVSVPILLLAGTKGDGETKTVIPYEEMTKMYDKLQTSKAMARKLECEHNDTDSALDGYVTAWFMWQLQNDKTAARAFIGDDAEIVNNKLYRGQRIDLST